MNMFTLNITLIMVLGYILLYRNPSPAKRKFFCIMVTLQLTLIAGLRHWSVGLDTSTYILYFEDAMYQSFSVLWQDFVDMYIRGIGVEDAGYPLFEKIFQIFSTDSQIFLMFVATIINTSVGVWIYKNSKEPCISFLVYTVLFYPILGLTALRQGITHALATFVAYEYIKKRKLIPFIIMILLAYFIHASAIIGVGLYIIANKKLTKKYVFAILITISLLFIFKTEFMNFVSFFAKEKYQYYGQIYTEGKLGAWNFSAVFISLAIAALIQMKRILANNPQAVHYYNALLVSLVVLPLVFINPVNMRIMYYFSPFIMLLVPEILHSLDKKNSKIVIYLGVVIVLLVLYFRQLEPYYFFWQ